MEVTRDQYQVIVEAAHQLSTFIYSLMESTPGHRLPEHWHELHDLMSLAGVIANTAERYRARAELPADPIDLTVWDEPDEPDYDPGPEVDDEGGMSEYRHSMSGDPF